MREHSNQVAVAAANNYSHTRDSLKRAFREILDTMDPPLSKVIRTGDRVVVKPTLRNGSSSNPSTRMVSHPEVVKMVIEAIRDCGGSVSIGDARSKRGRASIIRPTEQWIRDLASTSDTPIVSFADAGARAIRGNLLFPRRYLITRALLEADAVVNCANFQLGLLLAGRDPVALDVLALHAMGLDDTAMPTNRLGAEAGLGCADIMRINLSGLDWSALHRVQHVKMRAADAARVSYYDRTTRLINNTVMRSKPFIVDSKCTGCGDCSLTCPVKAIRPLPDASLRINPRACADCGLCVEACAHDAIDFRLPRVARLVRKIIKRPSGTEHSTQGSIP